MEKFLVNLSFPQGAFHVFNFKSVNLSLVDKIIHILILGALAVLVIVFIIDLMKEEK